MSAAAHHRLTATAIATTTAFCLGTIALLLLLLYYFKIRRDRAHLAADQQDHSISRLGLDRSVLSSLPVSVYAVDDPKVVIECAVCISEVSPGERFRILPKCGHGFHLDCVDMWFHSHSTCPLCRSPVGPPSSDVAGLAAISGGGYSTDSPNLPTNVLFWGNLDLVSSGCVSIARGLREGSSGSQLASDGDDDADAQRRAATDGDAKSSAAPVFAGMRSFKRFLGRDRRTPDISCGGDVEQGCGSGGGGTN